MRRRIWIIALISWSVFWINCWQRPFVYAIGMGVWHWCYHCVLCTCSVYTTFHSNWCFSCRPFFTVLRCLSFPQIKMIFAIQFSNIYFVIELCFQMCAPRVSPSTPDDHYRAVCRALATETLELRVFLEKIYQGETENLRVKADIETTKHELQTLAFSDWVSCSGMQRILLESCELWYWCEEWRS